MFRSYEAHHIENVSSSFLFSHEQLYRVDYLERIGDAEAQRHTHTRLTVISCCEHSMSRVRVHRAVTQKWMAEYTLPSLCLVNIQCVHARANRKGFMKYAIGIDAGAVVYITNLIKIG
jgi:hypothetical protein